jgi:hypothetical protein
MTRSQQKAGKHVFYGVLLGWLFALAWGCPAKDVSPPPSVKGPQTTAVEGPSESSYEAPLRAPTHRVFRQRGFSLRLPVEGWVVTETPSGAGKRTIVRATIEGPVDCRGSVNAWPRRGGEGFGTGADAAIGRIELTAQQIHWAELTPFGAITGYRYNLSGERDGRRVRVQGTLLKEARWWLEVRAWSSAGFTMARECHDRITGAFQDQGLGSVLDLEAEAGTTGRP